MRCVLCGSENQAEFCAELNIHFSGLDGVDKPAVLVFPKLQVCFACGATLFAVPENELRELEKGVAA
jgi:hypothetical protein